jgi:hypothetical protein
MKTSKHLALIAALFAGGLLAACSPAPGSSPSVPTVSLPAVSIDPSAAADAIGTVLDQLDTEIDANQTADGLTVEDRDALKAFVATIRSAVATGDLSAAQPTVDQLSAKLTELDAKLGTEAGTRLKNAFTQLQTLLAGS